MLPLVQRLALVGNSHEIALSFLISSQTRARLSVLHPLCIDRQVVLSVLEYQATFQCAHPARCQRSRSSEAAMVRRSLKATNAQRPNSRRPTVRCHQRFIYLSQNSLLSLKAWMLHLYEVCYPLGFCRERLSHVTSFQGAMTVYRTRRRLSHGRLRFHHLRSFTHFLLSVPPLLRIPTLMLLHRQPRLLSMRHPPSSFPHPLVRPLARPRSDLRLLRRLKASLNSLVLLHLPKMRPRVSILRPRIVKTMLRLASTSQRHLVCPVRGLQLLRLHDRRLPSPLHPRSRRPSCRAHDPIRFLRLPSQRSNLLLWYPLLHFPARAHCRYEHLRHPGAGFRHLALFVGRA